MPIILITLIAFLFIYGELSLLIAIGSAIGAFGVIMLLLLSVFIGGVILKSKGLFGLNFRRQIAQGEIPADSVVKSLLWMIAGILFIIPGFITDLLACLLLLLPSGLFEKWISQKFTVINSGFTAQGFGRHSHRYRYYKDQNTEVFEAEYEKEVDEKKRIK